MQQPKIMYERTYLIHLNKDVSTPFDICYEAVMRYKVEIGNYPTHMVLSSYYERNTSYPYRDFRIPIPPQTSALSTSSDTSSRPTFCGTFYGVTITYSNVMLLNEVSCMTLVQEEEKMKEEEPPPPLPTPPTKQQDLSLLDKFGDPITPGVVLACGHRRDDVGALTFGIVTGFTEHSILVKQLQRGTLSYSKLGRRYWERDDTHGKHWQFVKGYYPKDASYRYYITGMTEQDLLAKLQSTTEQIWLVRTDKGKRG